MFTTCLSCKRIELEFYIIFYLNPLSARIGRQNANSLPQVREQDAGASQTVANHVYILALAVILHSKTMYKKRVRIQSPMRAWSGVLVCERLGAQATSESLHIGTCRKCLRATEAP